MGDLPLGDATIAMMQGLNQYSVGLLGGYLIDLTMDQVPISEDNILGRLGRQFVQVALNGLALSVILKFLHGRTPGAGYRDFTGGYLLAIGLIQAQPSFMKNGKELASGLSMFIRESLTTNTAAAASDASKTQPV